MARRAKKQLKTEISVAYDLERLSWLQDEIEVSLKDIFKIANDPKSSKVDRRSARARLGPLIEAFRSVTKDKIRFLLHDQTAPVSSITVNRKSTVTDAEKKQLMEALRKAGIDPENTGSFVKLDELNESTTEPN